MVNIPKGMTEEEVFALHAEKVHQMTKDYYEASATDIGRVVLFLAQHEPGNCGDCSINHPIASIIDRREPAHVLLRALAEMDAVTAEGIVRQFYDSPTSKEKPTF